MTRAGRVEGGSMWALKCSTQRRRASLGHKIGSPNASSPTPPPLTPFFCVVNIRVKKLADWSSLAVSVAAKTLRPQLKAIYSSQNGVLSDLDAMYSPGRRRNK